MKKIDINSFKEKIKNFNINSFKEKIKKLNLGKYKQNIFIGFLVISMSFLVVFSILFVFKAKKTHKKIQADIKKIELIDDVKITKDISEKKLRNVLTVANTAYALNSSFSLDIYIDSTKKYVIYSMYESNNYKGIIDNKLFLDNGIELDEQKKKQVLKYAYNKEKLQQIIKDKESIKFFLSSYNNLAFSDKVDYYISNIKGINIDDRFFNKLQYNQISDVLRNLYVYELLFIEEELKNNAKFYENKFKEYQYPYNNFLYYIFFPSVNIWKDKYSGKINVDIFGSEYLKNANYIDLNLMSYWSNYFKTSYKGKLYQGERNIINDIFINKFSSNDKSNFTKLGIDINFSLNDDKSFYGLISKLTGTSNKKNLMIIMEFTYYLRQNVSNILKNNLKEHNIKLNENGNKSFEEESKIGKNYISSVLYSCLYEKGNYNKLNCGKLFGCENNCKLTDVYDEKLDEYKENIFRGIFTKYFYDTIKGNVIKNSNYDFKNSTFYKYYNNDYLSIEDINVVIGARLYNCLMEDGYCHDLFSKESDTYYGIKNTIIDFANCDGNLINNECKYKFIDKFENNYFIAYTMVNEVSNNFIDYNYLERLKDIYKNLSGLIKIGNFTFKEQESSLIGFEQIDFSAETSLNVFYNSLNEGDFNDILKHIGIEKCSSITNGKSWSIKAGIKKIENVIDSLYEESYTASSVYDLNKILSILKNLNKEAESSSGLNKLIKYIQSYRILKEAGYCTNR